MLVVLIASASLVLETAKNATWNLSKFHLYKTLRKSSVTKEVSVLTVKDKCSSGVKSLKTHP